MSRASPEKPWVLLRKGLPMLRFDTAEEAKLFYDRLRFNSYCRSDAALFGPNGEGWYCLRKRTAPWIRDDNARRRRLAEEAGESAA